MQNIQTGSRGRTRSLAPIAKFAGLATVLFVLFAGQAFAETPQTAPIKFVNVADNTQGLSDFSQFPAINDRGEVAFVAIQSAGQAVFKWKHHNLTTIASTVGSSFSFFTDDVVLNTAGLVGFRATLNTGGRAAGIFVSDGLTTKTIVNSSDASLGLTGPGIGPPSINAEGTVAFQASRIGFRSTVIFTGDGDSLTPVLDTLNSGFGSFGAVAINASGEIVFRGVLPDRNEGVFVITPAVSAGPVKVSDIVDSNNPDFFNFGDPVINDAGTVADFAGGPVGVEIISGSSS